MTYHAWLHNSRRQFIINVLIVANGNQCTAAKMMGIHRNTLKRMMAEDGIDKSIVRKIRFNILESSKTLSRNIYRMNGEAHV